MKRYSFDITFLLLVLGLTLFGIIMIASASGPMGYERFADSYYYVKHQLFLGVIPGLLLFALAYSIPYQVYKKYASALFGISIGLLILVFIPGIGTDHGTFAQSWIQISNFSFQPSEAVKLTFLLYLAALLEKRSGELHNWQAGLIPFLVSLGIVVVLMLLQPDLGTLSIMIATAFVMYFCAGGEILHIIGLGLASISAFFVAVQTSERGTARLMTFLHPELDPQGIGYQINQALLAIGSGGFFGRGYGHSVQKFQYLPEVIGDSIFAIVAEELGFFLTALFILFFVLMILRGLRIAYIAKDAFGRHLVIGIMAWLGVQAFVNIGATVGLLPFTGVPLPFVSYGGTALTISLLATGIVLNVSKTKK